MRWRATALLALVLVVGAVIVTRLGRVDTGPRQAPATARPEVLAPGPPESLVRISLRRPPSAPPRSARRDGSTWRRDDGTVLGGADIDYLLGRLAPLLSARTFETDDPGRYGLAGPDLVLELERDGGGVTTVAVGHSDLEGSLRYVGVQGRRTVDMVSARIVDDVVATLSPGTS